MRLTEKYIPHYTYHEWLHWEGSWELIEGIPVSLIPKPLAGHQRVAEVLETAFTLALQKGGCKNFGVFNRLPYRISTDTLLVPDLLIAGTTINKTYLSVAPAIVIEILSKATETRDRGIKYNYYEREGVTYYLLADCKKKVIEIYQLIEGKYQLQPDNNSIEFVLNESCKIAAGLENIWV